jgi:general stress protein CsbA
MEDSVVAAVSALATVVLYTLLTRNRYDSIIKSSTKQNGRHHHDRSYG